VQVWPDKYDRHVKPGQSYYEMLEVVHAYTTAAREDANAARILALFRRLQRLDEAGNDPAQLQVLKHAR